MISNARGRHVSPGIYMKEVDVPYAPKSAGMTTLGLVGETLKGPAFQPISISDWAEYKRYFGGTSAEKYVNKNGDKVAKYELPYIAKEYLKESKQLEVTRVLGLSGYNAGPAFVIYANNTVIGVLRSKATINKIGDKAKCDEDTDKASDNPSFLASSVSVEKLEKISGFNACTGKKTDGENNDDERRLKMTVTGPNSLEDTFNVSLNPSDFFYIFNVLGTNPLEGDKPIYIEEFYEEVCNNLFEGSNPKIFIKVIKESKSINKSIAFDGFCSTVEDNEGVELKGELDSILKISALKPENDKKYLEKIYLDKASLNYYILKKEGDNYSLKNNGTLKDDSQIYLVSGKKYEFNSNAWKETVDFSFSDYRRPFNSARTPWFVSEVRGISDDFEVKKLFRLYTISDGNAANTEIKVSIENILPEDGLFDVVIRDFYDSDSNPIILERFAKCSMNPMSENYIGLKMGTMNGEYELRSNYVLLEVIDDEDIYNSVPAGFLGYPMREYRTESGTSSLTVPDFPYNVQFHPEIKERRQYFGISDITGIDVDVFSFKGVSNDSEDAKLSKGFHLDYRLTDPELTKPLNAGDAYKSAVIRVNGEAVSSDGKYPGFVCVNDKDSTGRKAPMILSEAYMEDTIYRDRNMRKFTACFFGGFDGWDIYRPIRTNTDEYTFEKYNGRGAFYRIPRSLTQDLRLPSRSLDSDYYAYLAGYNTMNNPEEVEINLFATPGIDWENNNLLTKDAIEMIEDYEDGRGGDAYYIITTPENISGKGNSSLDTARTLVDELELSDINTSYAGTYWPWIKYYDSVNKAYIDLPVTKDVVRNLAYIDNNMYPWMAPAGTTEKGKVNCVRATYTTRCSEEDVLYEGMINPVKTFAVDGVKVWGNKTLYRTNSPLNRINVRRLMIRIKKLITKSCRSLIFEPNDMSVRSEFLSIVNPILDDIRANRGITDFKIQVDNSVEALDEHVLPAKIWIKPTPTLEYIDLTFVITPQGGSFTD